MEKRNNTQKRIEAENAIYKMVICIAVLCIVMSVMLAVYNSSVPDTIAKLEEKGKVENVIWLVRYGSCLPPVIIIAIILTCFYSFGSSYTPVVTQKHKAIIVGVTFAFTYVVLVGYALLSSPGWNLPETDGEEVKTMIETTAGWFLAQVVPFMILLSYHLVRMSSEKKELEANEG